jgi:hypothetical protein
MKVTKEEAEFVEKSLADFRKKKSEPVKPTEAELDLQEIEQEIVEESADADNECASCGWKFNGKPENCPQCEVALDWEN